MANLRTTLMVGLVVAIVVYISVVLVGRTSMDAFTDLGEKMNVFTLYYMNGCPHCETILPEYKKFAASGQFVTNGKKTKIRMLEQSDPSAAPELEARSVKGFPTFYLETANGKLIEYQGDRSIGAIQQFIGQNAV